ncbi:hypothetical protein [Naasia lichenicola]|uniref:Uncharacterized protein n=1 Tax=Naasia lichenicola TaxID=2565933 RepID=A0A4S4FHR6_9MICO|nr:hypothetical protein [Naasia lichenicola]THG28675.1 hypothetical protein E6C64_17970 [Naasia lichenicola]
MTIDTGSTPVSVLDRAALRLGLRLILWGRRERPQMDPVELHRRAEVRRAAARERDRIIAASYLYRL